MTCRTGTDAAGNRFIACSRFERRPVLTRPACIVPPSSPWQIGATVTHDRYGAGTITGRNEVAVSVQFPGDDHARTFMLAYVGTALRVVNP